MPIKRAAPFEGFPGQAEPIKETENFDSGAHFGLKSETWDEELKFLLPSLEIGRPTPVRRQDGGVKTFFHKGKFQVPVPRVVP